jgi:hypothetical protein
MLMNRRRAVVLSALISPVALVWSSSRAGVTITGVVDFAGASTVQLRGISQDGRVVGYRTIGGVTEGFIRSGGVDTFFQNAGANTFALGINDNGAAVGGSSPVGGASSAFIRSPDGIFTTFNPGGTSRSAVGINNAGVTVGGLDTANGAWIRAADGTETSFTYAGQPGDTVLNTNATDILNDGTIIGHSVLLSGGDLAGRGWLSTDGGATFLDIAAPGFVITFAWGGNDSGLVVGDVSSSPALTLRSGFVLDRNSGAYTFFNVAGADWTVPTGINDAGQIVGFWRSADDGRVRGFTAFVPSPGTASTLAGLALIACRRRR